MKNIRLVCPITSQGFRRLEDLKATEGPGFEISLSQIEAGASLVLTEFQPKAILSAYGIPTPPIRLAASVEEAVLAAVRMGYPVAWPIAVSGRRPSGPGLSATQPLSLSVSLTQV